MSVPNRALMIEQRRRGEERVDLAEIELRLDRLQNTVRALAAETSDITVGRACTQCGRCLLLRKQDALFCPSCGDGRNL